MMKPHELNSFPDIYPIDTMFYIDTVVVWLPRNLDHFKQRYIQPDPKKIVYNSHAMKYPRSGYISTVSLHQPTPDVLQRLIELVPDCNLTAVHFVKDEVYESKEDADYMEKFYQFHVTKKKHGKQNVRKVKRTQYLCKKNSAVNLCTYGDKVSRFTGQPCVHSELRLRYKKTLQKIKINGVKDLIEYNGYNALFMRYITLHGIQSRTYQRIGQIILGETNRDCERLKKFHIGNRSIQFSHYERAGRLFVRGKLGTEEQFEVQDLVDLMRRYDKKFKEYLEKVEGF